MTQANDTGRDSQQMYVTEILEKEKFRIVRHARVSIILKYYVDDVDVAALSSSLCLTLSVSTSRKFVRICITVVWRKEEKEKKERKQQRERNHGLENSAERSGNLFGVDLRGDL